MKTIYLVHDGQEAADERISALEDTGFAVTSFQSQEGLMLGLGRELPDMVLMDILLDGPHGFAACEVIRTQFSAQEVPVILLSGIYRGRRYHQEAARVGAQAYLLKPVLHDDVVRAIVEVMEEVRDPTTVPP